MYIYLDPKYLAQRFTGTMCNSQRANYVCRMSCFSATNVVNWSRISFLYLIQDINTAWLVYSVIYPECLNTAGLLYKVCISLTLLEPWPHVQLEARNWVRKCKWLQINLPCGQLNYASFRKGILWSSVKFFQTSVLDVSFIPFLNQAFNSPGEDDLNLAKKKMFFAFSLFFTFHLIIPNTFSIDSGYICCQETQGHVKSSARRQREGWAVWVVYSVTAG